MKSQGMHAIEVIYPDGPQADPTPCRLTVSLTIPESHVREWDEGRLDRFLTAVAAVQKVLDER